MLSQLVILTQSSTFIIGDLAKVFGYLMDAIYNFFGNTFGLYSLGLSIIIFTIITRLLMLPLAFRQQKSMKEMQRIQPEIKKIQDKYKKKKDQESQQKQQAELSALYQEHGVNPLGGCLPLLIQMPIIFSLYQVLRNIPAYIGTIGDKYYTIVDAINAAGYNDKFAALKGSEEVSAQVFQKAFSQVSKFDITVPEKIIDVLYKFQTETWTAFYSTFSDITATVQPIVHNLMDIYGFFGINLADRPDLMTIGVLIPVLNVVVQFFATRASMSVNKGKQEGAAASTNQTMMYTMPLISGFFSTQLPAGLGLYWLMGSLFQLGQQLVINRHLHQAAEAKKK